MRRYIPTITFLSQVGHWPPSANEIRGPEQDHLCTLDRTAAHLKTSSRPDAVMFSGATPLLCALAASGSVDAFSKSSRGTPKRNAVSAWPLLYACHPKGVKHQPAKCCDDVKDVIPCPGPSTQGKLAQMFNAPRPHASFPLLPDSRAKMTD